MTDVLNLIQLVATYPVTQQLEQVVQLARIAMGHANRSLKPDEQGQFTAVVVQPEVDAQTLANLEAEYAAVIVALKAAVIALEDNPSLGRASHPLLNGGS